jgi:hypothetical protein
MARDSDPDVSALSPAWTFPLALFGNAALIIGYFKLAFTPMTRWVLLAALALFLLSRARLFLAFRTRLAPALLAWFGWISLTILWSDLPLLSATMVIAVIGAVVPLVSGGIYWARYAKPGNPLSAFAPLVVLSLFSALFGFGGFRQISGGVLLFGGLSDNENLFGLLIAISLLYPCYAAWRARAAGATWFRVAAWVVVVLILVALLILTRSRASILVAACMFLAFALAALPRKTILIGGLIGTIMVGAVAMLPSLSREIAPHAKHFVDKGHQDDPFFTRRQVWNESREFARVGGVIGMGLGVNADPRFSLDGGRLAGQYGREKGSSPLSTIEETGLIGLAISVILLFQLFRFLIPRTIALANRDMRVAAALVTGALAGLVLQSAFEAWWTLPAPESSSFGFFWALVGIALGIVNRPAPGSSTGQSVPESPLDSGQGR